MRPSKLFFFYWSRGFFSLSLDDNIVLAARSRRSMFRGINARFRAGAVLCIYYKCVWRCRDEQSSHSIDVFRLGKWVVVVVENHHPARYGDVTVRRRRTWSTKARPSVYDPPKPIPHVVVGKSTTTTALVSLRAHFVRRQRW